MRRIACLAALLLVAGSASAKSVSQATAQIGQTVRLNGIKITPVAVVEDSRCPRLVTCVWRGRLRIRARVNAVLQVMDDGQPISIRGGRLTLVDAVPRSERGEGIPPTAYRFRFRFER
jgi:hypothetical protein